MALAVSVMATAVSRKITNNVPLKMALAVLGKITDGIPLKMGMADSGKITNSRLYL